MFDLVEEVKEKVFELQQPTICESKKLLVLMRRHARSTYRQRECLVISTKKLIAKISLLCVIPFVCLFVLFCTALFCCTNSEQRMLLEDNVPKYFLFPVCVAIP